MARMIGGAEGRTMMTSRGELDGKVAIVTGGARRIGRAISLRLGEVGASVVVNTKSNADNARQTAQEIESKGGSALAFLADVTDPNSVKSMVDATMQKFGRIDILVHNAVARDASHLAELTLERWHQALAVVLDGAFLCSQACTPQLSKIKGSIILIGGLSAHRGSRHLPGTTAKAGLLGMTRSLALDLAPNVTVNCVAPGRIEDKDYDRRVVHGDPSLRAETNAAGRTGTSQEVADAVAMLCSPRSRFITGQTIHVNGGAFFGS
jgi:3-oxoacyl-[acyl-carrier protein] reductase